MLGATVGFVETFIVGTVTSYVGSVAPGSATVGKMTAYVGTGWLVGGIRPPMLSVGDMVGVIAIGSLVASSLPIDVGKRVDG